MIRALFVFGLIPCAAAYAAPSDFNVSLDTLERALTTPLASAACESTLRSWRETTTFPITTIADAPPIMNRSFAARARVRAQLRAWSREHEFRAGADVPCVDEVRRTLSTLRRAEDELALTRRDVTRPGLLQGEGAWLSSDPVPVRLRSGDLLLSHGPRLVSAAIAKIGRVGGDFAHVATIFIDAPAGTEVTVADALTDPRVRVIEAWIEAGAFERPFAKYAKDRTARVSLYRPRQNAPRAHHAALAIHQWVAQWQRGHAAAAGRRKPTVNDNIPYDFRMNLNDHSQVFCSELVAIAQASVGWTVPMFQTDLKQNVLTQTMGIASPSTFAPSDIDVDPRFDLRAEWRDLDQLARVLRNDDVLVEMYARMEQGTLEFRPTFKESAQARLAWTLRQADLALMTKMSKSMTASVVAMVFALDRVAGQLMTQLFPE